MAILRIPEKKEDTVPFRLCEVACQDEPIQNSHNELICDNVIITFFHEYNVYAKRKTK